MVSIGGRVMDGSLVKRKAYLYASMKHRHMLEKVTLEIKRSEEISPVL